uniref:Ig-like domain-containing protein n=1 Tax=Anopheles maculatus TaxID=74869 RepID=A0A182SBV8_9DIPT
MEDEDFRITVPPSVRAIPPTGQVTARKGGAVTLECKASGNPVPSIYWTKRQSGTGKSAAKIGEGPVLSLERVERQQAGVYQCTADNNVGDPVTVDMRLDVLYICKHSTIAVMSIPGWVFRECVGGSGNWDVYIKIYYAQYFFSGSGFPLAMG